MRPLLLLLRSSLLAALGLLILWPAALQAQQLSPQEREARGLEALTAPAVRTVTPGSRAVAPGSYVLRGGGTDDVLFVPESSADAVAVIDAASGDLLDAAFIQDSDNLSTPIQAMLNFDGDGVFVSDQLGDAIFEYDLEGNFVGLFAPAGGVDTAILDNVRGFAMSPDGTQLWVTVGGGANGGAIAAFDTDGTYLGNFIEPGTGGIASPFDIYVRDADVLVSDIDGSPDRILRYNLDGTFIEVWNSGDEINFPQQIAEAEAEGEGDVLVGAFSLPSGVFEYASDGTFEATYNVITGNRGVYELPNGNILTTNGAGLHEITRSNTLVRTIVEGSARFITQAGGGGETMGIALPVTFEEDLDYELTDFGGAVSMLVTDPTDETNTVVETLRPAQPPAECFAGTTVADASGFVDPIPFAPGDTKMNVRVWSPEAGVRVLFKVEQVGNPGINVETFSFTTVAMAWETIVFDFANPMPNTNPINFENVYNKASIFFDFQCNLPPTSTLPGTYYWDDVAFGDVVAPGAIEFSPNPLVEMLASGETGTETVTITNNSGGDVSFDFTQYSNDPDPALVAPAYGRFAGQGLEIGKDEIDTRRGDGQSFGEGGPDAFGYTWIDSNEPGGPAFDFVDIAGTGTATGLADDAVTTVDLPFTFSFYGEDYDQVVISSNGFLSFDTAAGSDLSNDPIPTATGTNNLIAGIWDDLNPANAGADDVYFQDMGDGRFVVQWNNVPHFNDPAETTTFEIILNQSGSILLQYETFNDDVSDPLSYTVGIENADGSDGLQIAFNEAYLEDGLAVSISAAPTFVTDVSPATGTIPAGGTADVDVTFDASGLLGGAYDAALTVETDLDADPSTFELNVQLIVEGMAACMLTASEIAFDDAIVGTSSTEEATVMNGGTDACELTSASADGAFSVDGFSAVTLAPGASTSFDVVFTPSGSGDATGTLTVAQAGGDDLTAALSGTGLAEPTPSVDPVALTINVGAGAMGSGSFTLSNTGGADAADLVYDISVSANRPSLVDNQGTDARERLRNAVRVLRDNQHRVPSGVDLVSQAGFEVAAGVPTVAYATRGGIDCDGEDGIIIQDDGVAENGYSANASTVDIVTLVDKVTPVDYPATFTNVCVSFITLTGGPSTLDFDLQLFADDGVDGAPGTMLGSVSATATGIPAIAAGNPIPIVWQTVDLTSADVTLEAGSVFIGVSYAPQTPTNVFLASDQSADRPPQFAGGFFGTEAGGADITWAALGSPGLFEDYRALFVRPVISVGPTLVSVSPESGVIAPGDDQEITIDVDATDVEQGTYEFDLVIATNDPSNPTVTVDLTVNVGLNPANEDDAVPTVFALRAAYPNPFAAATTIGYDLPEATQVTIEVYDAVGRRVATLVDAEQAAGRYEAQWDARSLASGVYLYRIQAGSYAKTMKVSLVR